MIAPVRIVDGFIALVVVLVIAGWIVAWLDDRRASEHEQHQDHSDRAA